jgi:hypothetical protein
MEQVANQSPRAVLLPCHHQVLLQLNRAMPYQVRPNSLIILSQTFAKDVHPVSNAMVEQSKHVVMVSIQLGVQSPVVFASLATTAPQKPVE